jgi:hypothetical protein
MRTFRIVGFAFLSLFTAETAIAILDWLARIDWLKEFMLAHPNIAGLIRTPFSYVALLILGFGFLRAEQWLGRPRILAKFVNGRMFPDGQTTTMQMLFDQEMKVPGYNQMGIDRHWFIEVQLANESETPTTIVKVKVRVRAGRWWNRKSYTAEQHAEMGDFLITYRFDGTGNQINIQRPNGYYEPVPNLLELIHNVALTRGIGHRGWLRFRVPKVTNDDVKTLGMDIWLVDALDGKHKVIFKKKEQKEWDNNFFIMHENANN